MVFNHILDFGSGSEMASQAAECAGEQGRFWEMHLVLFQNQSRLFGFDTGPALRELAQQVGLDRAQFDTCLSSQRYLSKVRAQHEAAKAAGVRLRPTFDINGQRVQGALPFEQLRQFIDAKLK